MSSNINVFLLDGTYPLSATLSFGASDSGTNGYYVIWQAAPNATPVISGGTQIGGWTTAANPAQVQASVGAGFNTRQLYVNGVRMPRAGGKPPPALTQTSGGYTDTAATMKQWGNPTNIEFEYSGAGSANHHWTDSRCPIGSIDNTGTVISMAQPCWGNLTTPSPIPWFNTGGATPTYVENAYELLDSPGEWYLNSTTGTLYYMPLNGQDMRTATVVAPTLETLLAVTGTLDAPVQNLIFQGLTFAYATWLRPATSQGFAEMQANFTQTDSTQNGTQGGCLASTPQGTCPFASWTKTPANVTFHAAKNVTLVADTFTHLGGAGLGFEYGSAANEVSNCVFTDISGTGIQLGGTDDADPTDPRATVSGIVVDDNYIHDLPVEYLGGVGIFVGYTTNATIQNNLIANTSYSGVSIGWGGWAKLNESQDPASLANVSRNNSIVNNHIFNTLQSLFDGGPIYSNGTRGTQMSNGDLYSGNHLHDSLHLGHGVYDDIGSRFVTVNSQVVYNVQDSWGGCVASGDLVFENGFWATPDATTNGVPSSSFSQCSSAPPDITSSNDSALSADPAAGCEANASCAAIAFSAGPATSVVDGRGERVFVDDQDSGFVWTGSWAHSRAPDLYETQTSTTTNGDSFQYSFVGTGIDYLSASTAPSFTQGNVSISVDGVAYPTANCAASQMIYSQVCASVRGLSPGTHTLTAAKVDGTYMSVDGLRIYTAGAAGTEGTPLDDLASGFVYTGNSWATTVRSNYGEYESSLHYATANGDGYTVSFVGTGAALFGDNDPNRGPEDVSVDGTFVQSVNALSATTLAQQRLFAVQGLAQGAHTISVVKRGGTYMDIDRVDVYGTTMFNDNDASVTYSGSGWVDSTNRGYGDYDNDVHYTQNDGDRADFQFTGSGVDVVTETSANRGLIDVRVDGVPRGEIFTYSPNFTAEQTVYRLHGLTRGSHDILLTKHGAQYMAVDAFTVVQ